MSIKLLARGEADEAMQQHAFDLIIKKLCGIGNISFEENNPHITAFREGKRTVGSFLLEIVTAPIEVLTDKKESKK